MFDFATTDLSLAIAHHLLIFVLAGVLAFEIGVIRPSMKREDVLRTIEPISYRLAGGATGSIDVEHSRSQANDAS